jgi:addiction module HigA family antidote
MAARKLAPIHPGEILLADFLEPLGLSQYRVARDISVPPRRINEIVHGTRSISADTALRLARYFGTANTSGSTFRPGSTSRRNATDWGSGWRKR